MIPIKLPANGLTEKTKQVLESYNSKILEVGKKIGCTEDTFPLSLSIEMNTSICIPRFLDEEYEPFEHISDLADETPTSLFCKLYIPIRDFWRDCSNLDGIGLDETLVAYNRAYGIVLHALNTVRRPNEYIEIYSKHALNDDYLMFHTIMGIVYNALLGDSHSMYVKLLLDDIKVILEKDVPEFLNIDYKCAAKESEPAEWFEEQSEKKEEPAPTQSEEDAETDATPLTHVTPATSSMQEKETTHDDVTKVFPHTNEYVRERVAEACNSVKDTRGGCLSGKAMAHLKQALDDMNCIKAGIQETDFVKALCAWKIISLDKKKCENLRNAMNKAKTKAIENGYDQDLLKRFQEILSKENTP